MIATPHIIVGSAVGSHINSPWVAFAAGFVSHHILDFIPHLDYGVLKEKKTSVSTWLYIGLDIVASLAILIYFLSAPHHQPNLIWGALGGLTPDIVDNSPLWMYYTHRWPITKQHWQFHLFAQNNLTPHYWWLNVLFQATLILISLAFIPY